MTRTPITFRTAAALALLLAVGLAACSGGGSPGDGGAGTPAEQPGVFRTLATWAGSPDPGGPGHRDGIGTAARFELPHGLAGGADGSLWVSEPEFNRVRHIDAQGEVRTVLDAAALAPRTDAEGRLVSYGSPQAVAAGPSGELFVAVLQATEARQERRWAVLRLTRGAVSVVVAQPGQVTIAGDSVPALALDRQGRLYVGDQRCAIWRSDGEVLSTTRPRGAVLVHASDPANPGRPCSDAWQSHGITRLVLDSEDRVLFTLRSGELQRIEPDGRLTTLGRASGVAFGCHSMAFDRSGRLLLTGGTSALVQLDAAGGEQVVAGSAQQPGWFDGPAASARFDALCAVAIDREGRTVLVDRHQHTVRRIAADGAVSTVAGLALQAGHRDGTGKDALFGSVSSIGPGQSGDVLVADARNQVVRRVDSRQRVSTLAGVPGEAASLPPADGPVATTRLYHPSRALLAADGSLWIAEGGFLRVLGTNGMLRTVDAGAPDFVLAMAQDDAGHVVAVWGGGGGLTSAGGRRPIHHRFARYSTQAPQGAPERLDLATTDELAGRLQGAFRHVSGLCRLPDGSFAYAQGHAVLRRGADGTVTVLAGSPDQTGSNDGPALTARFDSPNGLACDPAGGVYVADTGNHTVRYVDAQRSVRTVLGTPGRAGHRVGTLPGELNLPSSLALVPGALVVSTGQGLVRAGF